MNKKKPPIINKPKKTIKKVRNNLLDNNRNSFKILNIQSVKLYNDVKALHSDINKLHNDVKEKEFLIQEIRSSLSWRITLPIRMLDDYIIKGKLFKKYPLKIKFFDKYPLKIVQKRLIEVYREEGYRGVYNRCKIHFPILHRVIQKFRLRTNKNNANVQQHNIDKNDIFLVNRDFVCNYQFSNNSSLSTYPLILIIAEVTLPQCYKYRVQQKIEHLESLGWIVKVADWREQKEVFSLLQICYDVIFYRVPAFPNVISQLEETKRLGLNPWWDVDDLIVDIDRYTECGFMHNLSAEEKKLLLFGADLYRKTMLSCSRAIASTNALADVMHQAGVPEVYVIENALDRDTLDIAKKIRALPRKQNSDDLNVDEVVIIYGSGTNTHNADFLVAANGILSALKQEKRLRLWIVGELDLPVDFQVVIDQIRYIPPQSYENYLQLLSQGDIAIAPLEPILFNDAKSNIKYLEASILSIPSICSPRQAFREVIIDQENGMLAETPKQWTEKILLLANNASLRKSIGQQSYKTVIEKYSPEIIANKQVKPIFGKPDELIHKKDNLKILVVNVYYDPYSFGGATYVTEEMARRLHQKDNVEVSIFTSGPNLGEERGLCKYESQGLVVYSVDCAPIIHETQQFNNLGIIEPFEIVLDAVQPDVVHFHAIQNMGLQMLLSCQNRQIPYVITLHDSWWLCNRQFMVKPSGKYCFQNKVDLKICQACERENRHLTQREIMMKQGLQSASLLLSPSETHRQIYIANDIDESMIKVNSNGIIRPKKNRPSRPQNTHLRFGFVAGDEVIKGALLIQQAFKLLSRDDWELKIIDSKVNMGYPPIDVSSWRVKGKVVTIPPYDEQGKDDFFYGIDVLLAPSQCKESYGMTVREALLRDVWVICSHPGGQSEDIIEGVNGNCISLMGNPAELKEVIEQLLDKASMFETYVNPHKDNIPTLEEQADELLDYYRHVTEEVETISPL